MRTSKGNRRTSFRGPLRIVEAEATWWPITDKEETKEAAEIEDEEEVMMTAGAGRKAEINFKEVLLQSTQNLN